MEVSEAIEIKKILIKAPEGLEQAFAIFPFLTLINQEFPEAELYMINEESDSLAYSFLPFKIKTFERPKDKKTLLKTHHFCANLNEVFNIDLFFDLENNFNSSFMGFNFRSTQRVGFETGWNKVFLTKKFRNDQAVTLEKKCIRLLELYTEKYFSDVQIIHPQEAGQEVAVIEKLFKEPKPPNFILVMLDKMANVTRQIDIWKKFFDSFQNQKFIIWSLQDEDLISELFSKIDLGHNELFMHRGVNNQELIYIMNKVQGVVVNNVWAEGLCTYLGSNSVSFLNQSPVMLARYDYYKYKPMRFVFLEDKSSIKYSYHEEEKDFSDLNQIVDFLHFQFKL